MVELKNLAASITQHFNSSDHCTQKRLINACLVSVFICRMGLEAFRGPFCAPRNYVVREAEGYLYICVNLVAEN